MYVKRIADFIVDVDTAFEASVIDVLKASLRPFDDNSSEERSWRESLPVVAALLKKLPEAVRENGEIALEAGFCVEETRADVVLTGVCRGRKVMVILENKRWSMLREKYTPLTDLTLLDGWHGGVSIDHPSRQAMHYRATLEYTNKYVQDEGVEIYPLVFLQNAKLREKRENCGPFDRRYAPLMAGAPIFTGEEEAEITAYLSEKLTGGEPGLTEKIYGSKVRPSREYARIMKELFTGREELAPILDDRQTALFGEIENEVRSGTGKKIFFVEGASGTGKTFVAVALMARLYQSA